LKEAAIMKLIKRRQLDNFDPTASTVDTEKELYDGHDIQFLFIDCNGDPVKVLDFAVEIDGIQLFNSSLSVLNKENALMYGFVNGTDNTDIGLLDIRNLLKTENGRIKKPTSIKFIAFCATTTCTSVDVIIGEVIDIQ